MTYDQRLQENQSQPVTDLSIRLAFEGVLKEYGALQDYANTRVQYIGGVMNFFILLLAGSLVALEFIDSHEAYFAYLVLAIIFSVLGLLLLFQARLANYVIHYEQTGLRKTAEGLLSQASSISVYDPNVSLFGWQAHYRDLTIKKNRWDGYLNMFSFAASGSLPLVSSIGLIVLFRFQKGGAALAPIEEIIFWISVLFVAALVVSAIQTALSGLILWRNVGDS